MNGILGGLLVKRPDWPWRLAFVIAVILRPFLFMAVTGALIERQTVMSVPLVYVATFLVGLGTAGGSGCTSGHRICGLSLRSFAAVITFLVSAVITAALVRFLGWGGRDVNDDSSS